MSNLERALNRTERLFNIILLLQQRPSMTSRDLADYFGVSRRTIFRDLRSLSDSGVPLTYGEKGGYEILDGYQLPPLMLTAREAATLLMGAEFMKLQADPSLRADADQVDMKIRGVLPGPVSDYVERIKQRTVLDPYWLHAVPENAPGQGFWYELSQAVAEQRSIIMEYLVMSRGEVTRRQVDPLAMVYYTDHWNLISFDHLRSGLRNFRLDHILSMHVLTQRFEPPPDFDLRDYLEEKGASSDSTPVTVRFGKETYRWARRSIPAMIEQEEEVDEEVEVTFRFENLDYVARWMLRFGGEARVISPASLKERVKEEALAIISQNGA
ncbi:MAG: helix-turn-helix transcriptional regulator [Bacteroidota bacterium]